MAQRTERREDYPRPPVYYYPPPPLPYYQQPQQAPRPSAFDRFMNFATWLIVIGVGLSIVAYLWLPLQQPAPASVPAAPAVLPTAAVRLPIQPAPQPVAQPAEQAPVVVVHDQAPPVTTPVPTADPGGISTSFHIGSDGVRIGASINNGATPVPADDTNIHAMDQQATVSAAEQAQQAQATAWANATVAAWMAATSAAPMPTEQVPAFKDSFQAPNLCNPMMGYVGAKAAACAATAEAQN